MFQLWSRLGSNPPSVDQVVDLHVHTELQKAVRVYLHADWLTLLCVCVDWPRLELLRLGISLMGADGCEMLLSQRWSSGSRPHTPTALGSA